MTKDHKIKKIFVVDMSNMLKGMWNNQNENDSSVDSDLLFSF